MRDLAGGRLPRPIPETVAGWMSESDLGVLFALACTAPGPRLLEVGSFLGLSTCALLQVPGGRLTCVDTWKGSPPWIPEGDYLPAFLDNVAPFEPDPAPIPIGTVRFSRGRVQVRRGPSQEILPALAREGLHFDFAFVDASHVYEDVSVDLTHAWDLLVPGGILVADDYVGTHPGVKEAWDEQFEGTTYARLAPFPGTKLAAAWRSP